MNSLTKTLILASVTLFIFLSSCSKSFDGKNGIKTVYYPGTENINQTVEYKDGKKNGYLKEYFENGNIKIIQQFKDDLPVDSAIWYHPNGKIADIQIHKNGLKNGCWKRFNKEGKLFSEINFKNGLLHGQSSVYTFKTLKPIEKFNYVEGDKQGIQQEWHNNGNRKSICYFNNDMPCLGTEEWEENGTKINHDFKISVSEQNKVQLSNKLTYIITIENIQPEDELYEVSLKDTGNVITQIRRIPRENDKFVLGYDVFKGGFVMEKVKLAAYRKTAYGNTVIKTTTFNVSANNF